MGAFSIWHWLIVLVIVVLVFGTKRLKNIGGDLGGAVKGFREAMKSGEQETQNEQARLAETEEAPTKPAEPAEQRDRQSSEP